MALIEADQLSAVKTFIFKHGRLLERQMFEYFFGKGTQLACVNAMLAYQNPGGGFGNGIEPDLLCPESSAIGAETALYMMDMLNFRDPSVIQMLYRWLATQQTDNGVIPHPAGMMMSYPHQPWWENSDDLRVLSLAGYLRKMGVPHAPFFEKVRDYFEEVSVPDADDYYGYPVFVYLKYCGQTEADRKKLDIMIEQLPDLLKAHADHYPLFSRAWYHAAEFLPEKVVREEAQKFTDAIGEDGGVKTPYPDLPWWDAPMTLDGLIQLKKQGWLQSGLAAQ